MSERSVHLTALRGGAELGGVALRVDCGETSILLDCGIGGEEDRSWLRKLDGLDGVWVSHAHLDHCGALGGLFEGRPTLKGWCAPDTRSLLEHSLSHLDDVDSERAADLADAFREIPFRRYVDLSPRTADDVRVMAFRAGHVLGAGMLLVEFGTEDPFRIVYTGDFCCHDQPVVPGAHLPRPGEDFEVDLLVMEGVLATDEEADAVDVDREWGRVREFAGTENPTLVAANPLGEAVEAAAALADSPTECVVASSMEPVFDCYVRSTNVEIDASILRFAESEGLEAALERGATVIAPGDQLEQGTPSRRLAARLVGDVGAHIAVFNRAYASTLAGRLVDVERGESIRMFGGDDRPTTLRAEVERFVLPNHAPRWQLVETVRALQPEEVVLVHGRRSRLHALRRAVKAEKMGAAIRVPENGETLRLD